MTADSRTEDDGAALIQARLPSSLAIKMHPATAEARQLGFEAGLFSKELYFYSTFKVVLA